MNEIPHNTSETLQSSPEGIQSTPKHNLDEDGKSVSSNMKNLSLQQGTTALGSKRAAAELAQGENPEEGGRPNKLRSANTEDSSGRAPPLHSSWVALSLDAGGRQGLPDPKSDLSEVARREPRDIWSSMPAGQPGSGVIPRDRLPSTFQSSLVKKSN